MLSDTTADRLEQLQHEFRNLTLAQLNEIKKNNGIQTPEMDARFNLQQLELRTEIEHEIGPLGPINYENQIKYGQQEFEKNIIEFQGKMENSEIAPQLQERRERFQELNKIDGFPQKDKGFEF